MKRILLLISALYCSSLFADTAAIISKYSNITEISRYEAQSLYLMRARRLNDGQSVTIFQMPQSSRAHIEFVRSVLNMSIEQYKREWDRLANTGMGTSVRTVDSREEMIRRVSLTSNGVGYIDTNYLIIYAGENDIKTLRIID